MAKNPRTVMSDERAAKEDSNQESVSPLLTDSVLIVNRGEIACRIIRTARKLGLKSIALYSYADRHARHVKEADEALALGPSDSYLNISEIVEIIKRISPTFVHPGYGFLSENSEFADQIALTSSNFLGPSSEVISLMGDKVAARELAISLNIPVVPGTNLEFPISEIGQNSNTGASATSVNRSPKGDTKLTQQIIANVGLPIMIKAAHGGGGRGMRRVYKEVDLIQSLVSAARESKQFFNSDKLFIERLIEKPRHLEVQAIGDKYGNVRILGDRDCSLQRSHQKIIEEAPAPFITSETRKKIFAFTEKMFKSSRYVGVGTAEFLLSASGELFFLEVNSRLQVEHCVTEMVTGLDIVELQFKVAKGESLKKIMPSHPTTSGSAIEVRLCAEQPALGFTPSSGKLLSFHLEGDRVDSGFCAEDTVSTLYDSLLAKVICHGASRDEAISRSTISLKNALIAGVETNQDLLIKILESSRFTGGELTTELISEILSEQQPLEYQAAICCVAGWLKSYEDLYSPGISTCRAPKEKSSRFFQFRTRLETFKDYLLFNQGPIWRAEVYGLTASITLKGENTNDGLILKVSINNEKHFHFACSFRATTLNQQSPTYPFSLEICRFNEIGQDYSDLINSAFYLAPNWLRIGTSTVHIRRSYTPGASIGTDQLSSTAPSLVRSPLPGKIIAVSAKIGSTVKKGDHLATLESMKMEHLVLAPRDGQITKLLATEGMTVESNAVLAEIGG